MKYRELIELITTGAIEDITLEEIKLLVGLSNQELSEIQKIKKELRRQVIKNLRKEDFLNEEDYLFILSKINELQDIFDVNKFISMTKNKILQSSKHYRRIIDKLISSNGKDYKVLIQLFNDPKICELEYFDDIIEILLESDITILRTNNQTNLLPSLLLDPNLLTNKEKYLAALKTYIFISNKIDISNDSSMNHQVIKIITNKNLISQDSYLELLEWLKSICVQNDKFFSIFYSFLTNLSEEEINTFLFKYHTLDYFIKNLNVFLFILYIEKIIEANLKEINLLEFAIKFFDTFINYKLLFYFIEIATNDFILDNKKYKEIIDITKRIKDIDVLLAYKKVALSSAILKSKHWRYILNTVASIKESSTAFLLTGFLNNDDILKREDLRNIIAIGLYFDDKTLQRAFFKVASSPNLLVRQDYIEIIKLTLSANPNLIDSYMELATTKKFSKLPYFYEILKYGTKIVNEQHLQHYTNIAKKLSKLPIDKTAFSNILETISSIEDDEILKTFEETIDIIESSFSSKQINKARLKFCIDILVEKRNAPNYQEIIYIIGDINLLSLNDYENIIKRLLEIKDYNRFKLIYNITNSKLGATYINDLLDIDDIHSLEIIKNIFNQLNTIGKNECSSLILKIIDAIKSKDKSDLYFILEQLSKETSITPTVYISYKLLEQMDESAPITWFINEFQERHDNNSLYSLFIFELKSKQRNKKREELLNMLRALNPDDEVDMTKIENILKYTPKA